METTYTTNSNAEGDHYPYSAYELKKRIVAYLTERGVNHICTVSVKKSGRFFELCGHVDSHWTRSVLFALVPKQGGHRYIIDKLRIADWNKGGVLV